MALEPKLLTIILNGVSGSGLKLVSNSRVKEVFSSALPDGDKITIPN